MSECIVWQGAVNESGYGTVSPSRTVKLLAHREAFRKANGYLPAVVMHVCDNRRCVNPEHLRPGTHASNAADKVAKGRSHKPRGVINPAARLGENSVLRIRIVRGALSCNKPAKLYGVDRSTITSAWTGKTWSHLGGGPRL